MRSKSTRSMLHIHSLRQKIEQNPASPAFLPSPSGAWDTSSEPSPVYLVHLIQPNKQDKETEHLVSSAQAADR